MNPSRVACGEHSPRIKPAEVGSFVASLVDLPVRVAGGVLPPMPSARPSNYLRTVARHAQLAQAWMPLTRYLLAESTLSPRDRELVILRIAILTRSAYETQQHRLLGLHCELGAVEFAALEMGSTDPTWTARERVLLHVVEDLHHMDAIDDDTWSAAAQIFDDLELMDLVLTAGHYKLVAWAVNGWKVALDSAATGVPPVARGPAGQH